MIDTIDKYLLAKSLSDGKALRYKMQKDKLLVFLGPVRDPRKLSEGTLFLIIEKDKETDWYRVVVRGLHLLDEEKIRALQDDWPLNSRNSYFTCGTNDLRGFILKYIV